MENYASFWLFFGDHRLFLCMHLVFGCGKNATTVFNQGDEGRSWYILLKGSVDVVIHGKGTVATLKEGDDFGKLALINDAPRYVTTRSTVTFFVSVFVSVSFSFCFSCSLYLSSHFFFVWLCLFVRMPTIIIKIWLIWKYMVIASAVIAFRAQKRRPTRIDDNGQLQSHINFERLPLEEPFGIDWTQCTYKLNYEKKKWMKWKIVKANRRNEWKSRKLLRDSFSSARKFSNKLAFDSKKYHNFWSMNCETAFEIRHVFGFIMPLRMNELMWKICESLT